MEKKQVKGHPEYNNILVNYGSLLVQKNDQTILPFLADLSVKVEKRYHEHPFYAKALTNIGNCYINNGEYTRSLTVFEKVSSMQLTLLGEKHKDYLQTPIKISVCHWQINNTTAAAQQFIKAVGGYLFLLNTFFSSMSESEKSKFWSSLKPNIDA